MKLAAETSVEDILATLAADRPPALVIIDSIQTLWTDLADSAPGTVTQVRAAAQALIRYAKQTGTAVVFVGHVTKDGQIAGPRVVEHMVDGVLYFEGEGGHHFRILRAVKNRFGPTDEIGVFEMTGAGLGEVANPSELFLGDRNAATPGAAVFAGMEGTRPLLVEIQALVAPTTLGTPRRAVIGWDSGPAGHGARGSGGPLRRAARRLRRLSQCRRGPAHRRAGRRSGGRRGAGLVAAGRARCPPTRSISARSACPAPCARCRMPRRASRRRRSSAFPAPTMPETKDGGGTAGDDGRPRSPTWSRRSPPWRAPATERADLPAPVDRRNESH